MFCMRFCPELGGCCAWCAWCVCCCVSEAALGVLPVRDRPPDAGICKPGAVATGREDVDKDKDVIHY